MKKVRKLICMLLVAVLTLSCFVGCKDSKETASEDGGKVKLKWVFGGPGKLEDSDRVWALFNEKLQDYLPGVEVEFVCIPNSDYAEKWRLMAASQEKVDIAWVSWALNFEDEVAKGSYMDLTELIDKYGQDMKAEFPEWLLDLTSIDGKIYAIPNYQMMRNPVGFEVDKAHVDKGWIDLAKAEEVLMLDRPWTKEDFKVFEDYLITMLDSGEKVKYVSSGFLKRAPIYIGMPAKGVETITCNAVVLNGDDECKVYDLLKDFPEKDGYYELMYDWYQKGIIRSDILENPTEKDGDYLLNWTSTLKGAKERAEAKRGKPMEIINMRSNNHIGYKGSSTNTALAATCQHPVEAMKLLNLLNSSKGAELLNLLSYGIEGEHYNKISDDRIEWLGEASLGSSNNKYGYSTWSLGNSLVAYTTQNDPEGWNEYIDKEINKASEPSSLSGFTLDQNPIKLEIAQYNSIMKEYSYLDSGTVPNYKELLAERNDKLVKAGSEKIVEEVRRQVNEWLKTKK